MAVFDHTPTVVGTIRSVAIVMLVSVFTNLAPAQAQLPAPDHHSADLPMAANNDKRQTTQTTQTPSAEEAVDRIRVIRVQAGDTLSEMFSANQVSVTDLHYIMEADEAYLSLETLTPGTELALVYDPQGRFSALTLRLDAARKVTYVKQPDGSFEYQAFTADTRWVVEVLRGVVDGSLYTSALRAGLTKAQILLIDQLLGNRLNFRKDLRKGDTFSVIVGHEVTSNQSTGHTRLEAISLVRGDQTYTAFLFEDGNYYNDKGESVTPAFMRWPTRKPYRVSSAFSPNRLHPITGRRSPHNGVDLATPPGTVIVSTGDGTVRRIGNHRYAGKYIDIDHGGAYTTRYLHLQKILVRKGDQVQRGEKIALSGNTGRSTGPHLHFEFHINGRPVDPMTADIPTAAAIPLADLARFKAKLKQRQIVMKYAASRSDILQVTAPS
ncbi:peptidoglycan DD-metalloendopeptidase family protein [Oceanobacter sp. 3_MG-2023]|uniref:peptidoglycan DD-metalloendopeptidase family protein n=1 Tax=Oceanobacter sp. 3_MG-2023 TaxID=3062622 RepID=UPI0027366F07|nr:peptidoglycan DD-metalloendopeptidase family protein [Oceanobacter sp. 3_MG-2023]